MAIVVDTKDCTALSDAELGDMADICTDGPSRIGVGHLSKFREEWVRIVQARDGAKLQAFAFATLERIGGTPCVLIGMAGVKRTSKRESALKVLMAELSHLALMSFPDEDVLFGTRLLDPGAFEAFRLLHDIVPRPGHKANGEERAWGRRLVRRFAVEGSYDEQAFKVKGTGAVQGVFDYESSRPETIPPDVAALFKGLKPAKGDCVVSCAWAMAEDLAKYL
jgi:hypothetical protein